MGTLATRLAPGWIAVCAVVAVGGCAPETRGGSAPGEELRVIEGTLEPRLLLTGELVAERAVEIFAPDASIRPLEIRWLAEDGAAVRAGEPVVEFDSGTLASRLEELRLELEQADQQLAVTRARVAAEVARAELGLRQRLAEVERARIDAGVPRELQPAAEYEERQLDLERAEISLGRARRELDASRTAGEATVALERLRRDEAEKELRRVEADLDRLTAKATSDGLLVLTENLRQGRRWQLGDQVWPGEHLARIPDLDSLEVEALLSDVDDGRLAAGVRARVTPDAFPELELPAVVERVDGLAQVAGPRSANRSFAVRLELAEATLPEALRPGMSVRVTVAEAAPASGPLAPRAALDLDGEEPLLLLAGGGERAVRLAGCDALYCALAKGAEAGERLRRREDEG